MLNAMSDMKVLVGIKPYMIDMDDATALTSGGTEFEQFLTSAADIALSLIQGWGYDIGVSPYLKRVLRAEVLLVKAEVIDEFGFQDAIDPAEFSTGGQASESRKMKKLSLEERGAGSAAFRDRAYGLLFGNYPRFSAGVA